MVSREEKQRHQHAWDGYGATDLHYPLGFVVIGREQLVVKKTVEDVAYQDLELTLLTLPGEFFGLHRE
jgi:hypothetical protein